MDPNEIAGVLGKALNGIVNAIVALVGVKTTIEMVLDPIRQKMVDEGRGPTDSELDTVFATMKANSDVIQGSQPVDPG